MLTHFILTRGDVFCCYPHLLTRKVRHGESLSISPKVTALVGVERCELKQSDSGDLAYNQYVTLLSATAWPSIQLAKSQYQSLHSSDLLCLKVQAFLGRGKRKFVPKGHLSLLSHSG